MFLGGVQVLLLGMEFIPSIGLCRNTFSVFLAVSGYEDSIFHS